MRIDKDSLTVTELNEPLVSITGRATEDDSTVTNDNKTWYQFTITWNTNRSPTEFSAMVEAAIEEQKPKETLTTLKESLITANSSIVDMANEVAATTEEASS